MRTCLVDHVYHQHTRSSSFVRDELLLGHDVVELWEDRWHGGTALAASDILAGDYDLIVVFQAEALTAELAAAGAENLVFIPMWDGARPLPDQYWRRLERVRIISFCYELHERLSRLGLSSTYAQYYPDPADFEVVTDFSKLRGFFWQRHFELTWRQVRRLIGRTVFESVHLHLAQDPDGETRIFPSTEERVRYGITTTEWFETRSAFLEVLRRSNVFFAPRLQEGIGIAFLEAMAMGLCVTAPDHATMNEYITHDVSGLLWTPSNPEPMDFSRARELGKRAREAVELGYERWRADVPRLRTFVTTPTADLTHDICDYTRFRGRQEDDYAAAASMRLRRSERVAPSPVTEFPLEGGRRPAGLVTKDARDIPLVTVVTVTLNCRGELDGTLANVLLQDYPNLEVIVVDGASTDGTLDRIREYEEFLDLWVSAPDEGPYEAMGRGADLANGRYILYMNVGDWFVGRGAIAQALRYAPPEADVIFGHHIYRRLDGVEELHKANDFEGTWRRLRAGHVDSRWLSGVPGHQATLVRADLLRTVGFDSRYRIAADHDLLYRLREKGARFYNCDTVIAEYASGGFSWANQTLCYDEWESIVRRYANARAARRLVASMRRPLRPSPPLLGEVLSKMARLRQVDVSPRRLLERREVRRSGLFDTKWYLEVNPDIRQGGWDPLAHYVRHGARELRDPSPAFNAVAYAAANHEVVDRKLNPLVHHHRRSAAVARMKGGAWSQYGEDAFLMEHGFVPRRGVFVDVGAGDPMRFSNTYAFEQAGWTGLCIDADPVQVKALRELRNCAVEWAAVGAEDGHATLIQCEDPDFSSTLDPVPGLAASQGWQFTRIVVPASGLEPLLQKHRIQHIDLLSLDTEGNELEICHTLDWRQHTPSTVVVEYLTAGRESQEEALREFFSDRRYWLIHRTKTNLVFSLGRGVAALRAKAYARAYRGEV